MCEIKLKNFDENTQKKINDLLSEIIMRLEERLCSAQDEATDIESHARNRHFRDAIEIVSSYILQSQNI